MLGLPTAPAAEIGQAALKRTSLLRGARALVASESELGRLSHSLCRSFRRLLLHKWLPLGLLLARQSLGGTRALITCKSELGCLCDSLCRPLRHYCMLRVLTRHTRPNPGFNHLLSQVHKYLWACLMVPTTEPSIPARQRHDHMQRLARPIADAPPPAARVLAHTSRPHQFALSCRSHGITSANI